MKKKNIFTPILLFVLIVIVCILATACAALLAGSVEKTLFDWSRLNLSNMIPVIVIGILVTAVIVCIAAMLVSRSVFLQIRDYFF